MTIVSMNHPRILFGLVANPCLPDDFAVAPVIPHIADAGGDDAYP